MRQLAVNIETDSFASASVKGAGPDHVHVLVDPGTKWDAESLTKLSAMLKGIAATLVATAALLLFTGAGDADSWWPGPSMVYAETELDF